MRVIRNNTENKLVEEAQKIWEIDCEHCGSELEITEEDAHVGALGGMYITCPCCGKESWVYLLDGIDLTIDNIEFPTHFDRTSSEHGDAKEVSAVEIKKEIQRGIEYLRQHTDEDDWFTEHGDLYLNVRKYPDDEEYWVVVTKDFYHTYIPFEKEDF